MNYLFWECTQRCNFKCSHCGSSCENNAEWIKDEISAKQMINTLDQVADTYKAKDIMIVITGGEPLLRRDIFEVASHAKKIGFQWGLVTNGYLLNKENVIKIKNAGMYSISVSIDGLESTHNKFRGMLGSYQKALDGIKLLHREKAAKFIEVTTVFSKHNINELEEMHLELSRLPINSWKLLFVEPIGRAENNIDFLSKDEMIKILNFIKNARKNKTKPTPTLGCSGYFGPEYEGKIRDWIFSCGSGLHIASILYNGDIYGCPSMPRVTKLVQGNIKNDSFVEKWENGFTEYRDPNRAKSPECESCQHFDTCLGGSYHLWDFKKNKTKLCYYNKIKAL